jgi:hypothetical protein
MEKLFFYLLIIYSNIFCFQSQNMQGWNMVDRFLGFRYAITNCDDNLNFIPNIQENAKSLSCFGWVQRIENISYVGEARCTKLKGNLMKESVNILCKHSSSVFKVLLLYSLAVPTN